MSTSNFNIDLECLFNLLGNAALCLPSRILTERIFQEMAYKLIEEYDVPRSDLREIFVVHDFEFEEFCSHCNERIEDTDTIDPDDNAPLCDECS